MTVFFISWCTEAQEPGNNKLNSEINSFVYRLIRFKFLKKYSDAII